VIQLGPSENNVEMARHRIKLLAVFALE